MASNADRAARWMDRALGRADRDLGEHGSVFYIEDTIYSYGTHFAMAVIMREKPKAEPGYADRYSPMTGEPRWVLVNGDSYSITTSGHQGMVRGIIARSGLPSIIIPFSALDAAGIERTSIDPLHVRPDRQEEIPHSADEVTGAHMMMDDPSGATRTEEYMDYTNRLPATDERPHGGYATAEREVPVRVDDPNRRRVNERSYNVAERGEDGRWYWTTTRHWLGDSLFAAKARGRRARYLSSFDYQEARPLYFLCELPRTPVVSTVEEAFEALKPNAVKDAEQAGLTVSRQGDMFAIPTDMNTAEVKTLTPYGKGRIVKRPNGGLLGTNHSASEVIFATEGRVYARGLLYHEPEAWRQPDHARRKMGDGNTWHLLIRNTVPRQRDTTRPAARV